MEDSDPRDLILLQRTKATMRFSTAFRFGKQPLMSRLRKNYQEWHQNRYFKILRGLVDSHPFEMLFKIDYGELPSGAKGFLIDIESQPVIVAKIRQLHMKDVDDPPPLYDNILYENKRAIEEIIHALGGRIMEEPSVLKLREWSKPTPLIEESLIEKLPDEVGRCLHQANSCYINGIADACSVMIRKAIEVAATKKLIQEGREARLRDRDGYEIGLGKKLDLLPEVASKVSRQIDEISLVKWLGDVSAHDPRTEISSTDLQRVVPLVRSFVTNLELKK